MAAKRRPKLSVSNEMSGSRKSVGPRRTLLDVIVDHRRVLGAALIIVCLTAAVLIAFLSNRAPSASSGEEASGAEAGTGTSDMMTLSTDTAVNDLVYNYYAARATGDMALIESMTRGMSDRQRLYYTELPKYVERFVVQEIYAKPGPEAGTYIVFVNNDMKLYEAAEALPSLESLYVCTAEDGSYYINVADRSPEVESYINNCNITDDGVIDLRNGINAKYNDLVGSNEELKTVVDNALKNLEAAVSEGIAAEQNATAAVSAATMETSDEEIYLKATDVINVRKTASTQEDPVGQTTVGELYRVIGTEGDWSKIEYEGGMAYVMTEYFEKVTADAAAAQNASKEPITAGQYTMKESCNIREQSNTDCRIMGQATIGTPVEVLEVVNDEWCKVKTGGITGYIKAEFIDY